MRRLQLTRLDPLPYAAAEAVNTLCSNLTFSKARCLVLTSCDAGAGKSLLSFHTARTLAGMGKRVALVDADLRQSVFCAQHGVACETPLMGLSHYLAKQCGRDRILYATSIPRLHLVPAGAMVPNPVLLLGGKRLSALLGHLRATYDVVLVDTPPVGLMVDAAMIAAVCDGSVLIARHNTVSRRDLLNARRLLEDAGSPVLGVVLNAAPLSSRTIAQYGHYAPTTPSESRKKGRVPL